MMQRTLLGALLLPLALLAPAGPDAPVADAAQRGDMQAVRELLRGGADVNVPQGDGMTALHWAAERGDAELAGLLVFAGADVRAGTRIGAYTPLHMAAEAASPEVVRVLLEAGSDPHATTTNTGSTPLHLAAGSGDPEVVRLLVEHGADVHARERAWGQTPLTFAAAYNRVEAIRALLAAGADPNATARSVNTADMAKADDLADKRIGEILEGFKEKEGGGPNWQPSPSQVQAAIEAAREVQRKWPDVPDADEAEADPNALDDDYPEEGEEKAAEEKKAEEKPEEPRPLSYPELVKGWGGLAPLHHAVRQGHTDAVLALLEGGADLDLPTEGDHTTPLLMATLNGQFDLARVLLERGADPNVASTAGATPLYAVVEREWAPKASYAHPVEHQQQRTSHLDMMRALLEAGADPNARLKTHLWYMEYTFSVLGGSGINLQGATPFWRAAYALDVDAMRLLAEHGADPNIPTTKPPERRRRRPPPMEEEKKAEEGQEPEGQEAEGQEPEADEEQEKEKEDPSGVPPVPVGGPAIYPIHAASGVGYGQSFAGNAHRHAPDNWLAAVKFLVEEAGADVNQRDHNAYTALHHAASRGDNELVLYLVSKGADVTVLSREGQTTADMANGPVQRVQPFPETVALLESLGAKNNHNCVSC